jgi:5-methyltetrahydropteroyltriglutamate--homocysteine methyltransferase
MGDLASLRDMDPRIGIGLGVIDVKANRVETPDEVAQALQRATMLIGEGRVRWIHPDCGFWMLKRSVVDRKIAALVKGRDLFLGRS